MPASAGAAAAAGGGGGFLLPLMIAQEAQGLLGGWLASRAANKAAQQQQAAAREAQNQLRPIYQQAYGGLTPYNQAGQSGLTALTALLGIPAAPPSTAPTTYTPVGGPYQGRGPAPITGGSVTGYAMDRNSLIDQSGLIVVRAPTGETRPVPASQVGYYVSRGATVVPINRGSTTPAGGSAYGGF